MSRTRSYLSLFFATGAPALLLAGAGCSPAHSPPTPRNNSNPATVDQARLRETSGGTYHVAYTPIPDPIPLNQVFALDVWVYRDADRKSPAAADVSIVADAAMPAHHHGMTLVPRAERLADGHFRVSGMLFHMPGAWEIYIDVREGEKVERARFEVEL